MRTATKSWPLALLAFASIHAQAVTEPGAGLGANTRVRNASFPITTLPTAHVFAAPTLKASQEKQGLVWLDNRRLMFIGSIPGTSGSKGLHIWDIVSQTVSQYSSHDRLCYAEGYINAFGPSQVRDDAERTAVSPVRYGPLGQEKDGVCDTRSRKGCPGRLNMSCKPLEFSPDSRPLGEESGITYELRSGDGVLVLMSRGAGTVEEQKERLMRPLMLLSKRYPKGKPLPITGTERVGGYKAAYSLFARRYVLVPSDPVEGRTDHSTNWPKGRAQPVYLMTSGGDVESIRVPSRPDWTTIHLAMPAVPGLVFMGSGAWANEWGGIFLYDKQDVLALDRGYAGSVAVSPDGCKVAYAIANDYGKKPGPNYQRVKSIRFCKGEE